MVDANLEAMIRQLKLEGEITSDDVLKAAIVKDVMYKDSNLMAIGTKILPPTPWAQLDAAWSFPLEVDGEFPVPEGAVARRTGAVDWVNFGATMEMAEFRFMLTDFAKARQQETLTYDTMVKRGSEYFAECQDGQIIDALYAGAGATSVSVSDGNRWDQNASTTDIEGDIMAAWNYIVDESNVRIEEMNQVCLVYPAKVDGYLRGLKMIGNVNQSMMTYLNNSFGFTFYPTRDYHATNAVGIQDDALLIVKGNKSGIHGVYSGAAIPLYETWREHGRGQEFLTKKLFFSKIQPESASDTTSDRICKITNVVG